MQQSNKIEQRTLLGDIREVQGDTSRREPWNQLTTVCPSLHEKPSLTGLHRRSKHEQEEQRTRKNKKTLHNANDKKIDQFGC
jgi:hypothetical protein